MIPGWSGLLVWGRSDEVRGKYDGMLDIRKRTYISIRSSFSR